MFQDRISNEEIINAAFCLMGFTSSSELTKTEMFHRTEKNFPLVFTWAKNRDPTLTKAEFQQMLLLMDPAHQSPHKVAVAEARASAYRQGKDGALLLRWIDLISINSKDAKKFLDEIAFRERFWLPEKSSAEPIIDIRSFLKMLYSASEEDLRELFSFWRKLEERFSADEKMEDVLEPAVESSL